MALPASAAKQPPQRTILFGVNYLPEVTCVEDFSPYWVTDNWTPKRMLADMRIMKAIGCSCIRFHIFPALPTKFGTHGVEGQKFIDMLDLGVKNAKDLGLKVHLDIADRVDSNGEEGVKFYLNRYKGKIESYQIGNERYDFPESREKLDWLQGLLELAHSIDPKAKMTADILVPDWMKIKNDMPELYGQLNVAAAHYYPVTDYHGWNDLYIADLVDHLSNKTGRKSAAMASYKSKKSLRDFGEFDAKAQSYDHPFYQGSWPTVGKEVWITEIAAHGYWRWGNLTPEDKRAADWGKVVDAVAGAKNPVTRIYHHCFRDKMSHREYGMGQSGIVYYDAAPRPVTLAFKKMAKKYAPKDSPMRVLDCEIARVAVAEGVKTVGVKVTLINKTAKTIRGELALELPDNASTEKTHIRFTVLPKKSREWTAMVDTSKINWGDNHVFARIQIPEGLLYGWGIIAKPKRVLIDGKVSLSPQSSVPSPQPSVKYVDGLGAVQDFLDKYADDCAIITGPCLGGDAEMGYRLKTVLQAMRCREVPLRPSILASEVLNRPVIVIGTPVYNQISRAIEMTLPVDQRITPEGTGKGNGLINVIQHPFGVMNVDGRFSKQSEQIGYYFGSCPAALYIAGPDDAGTKAATYDLIKRIWGSEKKYE